MIVGYSIFGQDDDNYMIDEQSVLDLCPRCGFLKKFDYHNPSYKVKRKNYDYFHPYDQGTIVSLRFKEFCLREGYHDILFKELERSIDFFQFFSERIVLVDATRTKMELNNFCPVCGNYEESTGSEPTYLLNVTKALDDGFYRTDKVFGSRNSKNPLIIVGPETHRKLKREKMKGLIYFPIES